MRDELEDDRSTRAAVTITNALTELVSCVVVLTAVGT